MTENEAIEILKENQLEHYHIDIGEYKEIDIAVRKMAIKAIDELQQYRAIGTVAEIKSIIQCNLAEHDRLSAFDRIGTIEEFKALKEKNLAKKPEVDEFDYGEGFVCGECESFLHYVDDDEHIRTNYCCHCGTKIDWQ